MQSQNEMPHKSRFARIIVPLLIVLVGVAVAAVFKLTKPTAKKAEIKAHRPVVTVQRVEHEAAHTRIDAMGTVAPSREISLQAQVGGKIVALSPEFEPGGILKKNDVVLRIDPRDYSLTLKKTKGAYAEAQADYRLEMGSQEVARKELEYMQLTAPDVVKDSSLALREPQLAQAQAKIDQARASYEQARLDLARCSVRAPFNALVSSRAVNLGSTPSTQTELGRLVGTDEYYIELAVPLDRIQYLDFSHPELNRVEVHSAASAAMWQGRLVRMTGTLTQNTRMAKVLVAVDDPLNLKQTAGKLPLVLGDYVSVSITGKPIENVVVLPRTALRDGNVVWLAEKGRLKFQKVTPVWKETEKVFVSHGLKAGQTVVLSDLAAPVEGMLLTLESEGR